MILIRSLLIGLIISTSGPAHSAPPSLYDIPLAFTKADGKALQLSELKGSPVVMTMTYGSCQFACPRILQRLKNLQKAYMERGFRAQFVVVSLDPERDTPARLNDIQKHDSETNAWIFLSGKESATRQLSMILGIRYQRNPDDGSISHDNKIVIIAADGKIKKDLNGLSPDVSEAL